MFAEVGPYCVAVASVSWMKPKLGGYHYARIWHRRDPLRIVKCGHRHRTPGGALKCGKKYVRGGEARSDFAMD